MKRAIFPGSFNPFTIGHQDIVDRGLELFDEIIIGVGHNCLKNDTDSIQERVEQIAQLYIHQPRVKVKAYHSLTVDFACECGASFILRGVRDCKDFEYERSIAEANKQLTGIETVLLYARPELAHVSSTLVRDLQSYGKDVNELLPKQSK